MPRNDNEKWQMGSQNGNAKRQDDHFYDVLKSTQERPSDLIDLAANGGGESFEICSLN